jgi:voltage-gated potassium channel
MKQNDSLRLLLGSLAALLLLASLIALLLWTEGALTSPAKSWQVLEAAIITLMGEYPDKPTTIPGRIIQLILLVFGTFAFGAIVGKTSSFFITRALSQETVMKSFKDHIIICNWNDKAPAVIRQLLEENNLKENKDEHRDIVIISASIPENRQVCQEYACVHFVQDDPTHHAALEKLQAAQAKAIILLADEETESPDDKNALIALAIKHLEQEPTHHRNIHVVGELVNLDRRRHLREAGVDEVISSRDYSSGIIAQSALFKNMSTVYQQLLTYSNDSNEFYFIEPSKYPAHLQGKTFCELSRWLTEYSAVHNDNPLLLVGVKRGNGEILLNPKQNQFSHLETDDLLIVMAFRNVERIG